MPVEVEQAIFNTASQDGPETMIVLEEAPAAGKAEVDYLIRRLAGYRVEADKVNRDKQTRAKPASSQAEAGNIKVVKARWNDPFFTEIENFPDGANDDQVDGLSGAFNRLCNVGVGAYSKVDRPTDRQRIERPPRGMGLM